MLNFGYMKRRDIGIQVTRAAKASSKLARAMRRSRTSYLSYIEETPKQYVQLEKVARQATRLAVATARKRKITVTYLEDGWVIRENPDGEKQRLVKIDKSSTSPKLNAGATFKLS